MLLSAHATLLDPGSVSKTKPIAVSSYRLPLILQRRPLLMPVTRLNCFTGGALPIAAYAVLCVRLRYVIRFFFLFFHNANTRYEWMACPCSAETFTLQEAPSFPWRTKCTGWHLF